MTPLTVALGATAGLMVFVFGYGLHLATSGPARAPRAPAAPRPSRRERTFVMHYLTEALGRPLTPVVLPRLSESRRRSVQRRVEAAGRPRGLTVERYVRRKIGEVVLYGGLAAVLFWTGSTVLALLFAAFAFFTDLDLFAEARRRRDAIQTQLPDFLDVLAVTVGAGLSFRQALERVTDSMPGVLAEEFRLVLQQMELGTSRRSAFEELRQRNRVEPLSQFVTAIQQAEELGAPLGQALMEISQDMRRSDAQFMRRKAQQLNPRVTMVTAVTLLPGLFVLIAGALFIGSGVDFGVFLDR